MRQPAKLLLERVHGFKSRSPRLISSSIWIVPNYIDLVNSHSSQFKAHRHLILIVFNKTIDNDYL